MKNVFDWQYIINFLSTGLNYSKYGRRLLHINNASKFKQFEALESEDHTILPVPSFMSIKFMLLHNLCHSQWVSNLGMINIILINLTTIINYYCYL
jgi:hypothetical protein